MNNLSWSGSSAKKDNVKTEETKPKKKIDYSKEISDLQKMHDKIKEKYELSPNTRISNALVDLRCAIENLKRFEY